MEMPEPARKQMCQPQHVARKEADSDGKAGAGIANSGYGRLALRPSEP